MMKNNAITILVDSVIWDCVGTTRCKVSPTPFLDSLKKESVTATKLYSHGPYTDAATRSLYTGRRCLDDFGYFFKLNSSPTNHFKVFHDNGYETYGLYYPYYMIGKDIKKDIDHTYYTAGFIFGSEWGGIYNYYSEIIKRRRLNSEELLLLRNRTELMFDVWIDFYNDAIIMPETIGMIKKVANKFDIKQGLEILIEEKKKYALNPEDYIIDFVGKGSSYKILSNLDGIDVDSGIDRVFLEKGIYKYYKDFFADASKNNFKANWLKNRPAIKRVLSCLMKYFKTRKQDDIMIIANYLMCIDAVNNVKRQSRSHWQVMPSARTQLNFASKLLEGRKDDNKPFYMSLHFLEPHSYVSFFTFDTEDRAILDEEFSMLDEYCKQLGTNFIGNLTYFLSIRYADFCIEQFCKKLKEQGLWENTVLTLLSDHGSSYSFYPLHGKHVNCFDEECYHVPVLIRIPSGNGIEVNDYHNSLDVLPTLYELMGFEKPKSVLGVSLLNKSKSPNDYVMTEYMGPGCPDILSRPIWFSIRDTNYIVGYKVGIYQNFEDGELSEVYDLKKDPNGFYDKSKSIDERKIGYLLVHLKKRHDEIKHDTFVFMKKLRETELKDNSNI